MPENKTIATKGSVKIFIENIKDKNQREDCKSIIKVMESVSNQKPVMWGSAIVGFGSNHYVYESGREGDISIIGGCVKNLIKVCNSFFNTDEINNGIINRFI